MALIPRWMRFYDPDALDNRDERFIAWLVELVAKTIEPYHRSEVRGAERVPEGPALYVGNHNSFAYTPDTYLFCAEVYRQHGIDAVPYGLAHEWILTLPFVNQAIAPMGAVRACHDNGERLLRAGKKVLVYPGGDLDAMRPFRRRHEIVFDGRSGYVCLALRTGVPIVPVVSAGAHSTIVIVDDMRGVAEAFGLVDAWRVKAFPITLSIPWGLTLGPPPPFVPFPSRILVDLLEPIRFERSGPEAAADDDYVDACAALVRERMQVALTRLAGERRRLRWRDLQSLWRRLSGEASPAAAPSSPPVVEPAPGHRSPRPAPPTFRAQPAPGG